MYTAKQRRVNQTDGVQLDGKSEIWKVRNDYQMENLISLSFIGFSLHKLQMKLGVVDMLIQNLRI